MSGAPDTPESLVVDGIEGLTPAWISHVLRESLDLAGLEVVDIVATPVGTGQMSDSARLNLRYASGRPDGAPASVIAKLPASDPTSRATGVWAGAYEKEVRFYQELAPVLGVRTPFVYRADIDMSSGNFVLLLEDLHPARQGDQLVGCSIAEAELALGELVGLHAPRWGDPQLSASWLRAPSRGMSEALPLLWDVWQARFEGCFGADVRAAGDALIESAQAFDQWPPRSRCTLVHNDYRLDNLLFGTAEGGPPVTVVDWQSVGIGRGATDVAYFLGGGLLEGVRRDNEERLVRSYHERLIAASVRGADWDDCWLEYRAGAFAGLAMTITAPMLVQQTKRGDEMFLAMARRHACHVLDLDAAAALAELLELEAWRAGRRTA